MSYVDLINKVIEKSNSIRVKLIKDKQCRLHLPLILKQCLKLLNEIEEDIENNKENDFDSESENENETECNLPPTKSIKEEPVKRPLMSRENSEISDELLIEAAINNEKKISRTDETPNKKIKNELKPEEDEDSCYLAQIDKLETNYKSPGLKTLAKELDENEDEIKKSLLSEFIEEDYLKNVTALPDEGELKTDETENNDGDDSNAPENQKYIELLKKYFGYTCFRKPQLRIIKQTIEEKRDQLVIMATGRGKSLCYQFPALYLSGLTVVVSPLISLMEDQVMSLSLLNVDACLLGSAQKDTSIEENLFSGKYKVVYITPEYIDSSPELLETLNSKVGISLLAIDECHCVSQWGNDFRPSYRRIGILRKKLINTPVIALTATATPSVRRDILLSLNLINPIVTVTSFDRPNLYLSVSNKTGNFLRDLRPIMVENVDRKYEFNGPTIIYCQTKKYTTEIMNELKSYGINCGQYHAGLSQNERKKTHFDFINERINVITATVAFGMGIDKPDIRNIIHYGAPGEMESYYQEIGRSGRDGEPSKCHIFYENKDFNTIRYFLSEIKNEKYRQHKYKMLDEMMKFLTTTGCRRRLLLNHFEDDSNKLNNDTLFKPNCCDNCTKRLNSSGSPNSFVTKDFTSEANKLLSCIKLLNERFGLNTVIGFLFGSKAQKITSKIPESTMKNQLFGSGKSKPEGWWKCFAQQLINEGFIEIKSVQNSYGSYPIIVLAQKGRELVDGKLIEVKFCETAEMKKFSPNGTISIVTNKVTSNFILPSVPVNQIICSSTQNKTLTNQNKPLKDGHLETELYKLLIKVRNDMVEEFGLSAHKICTNKALSSLAYTRPSKIENLTFVDDFPANGQKIGIKFIENIIEFCSKFKLNTDVFSKKSEISSAPKSMNTLDSRESDLLQLLSETKRLTYTMYELENKSIEEVANERNFVVSTVLAHLEEAILLGLPINFVRLGITFDKINLVERTIRAPPINSNVNKLTTIKDQLTDLSWSDLKICLSLIRRKYGIGMIQSDESNQTTLSLVKYDVKSTTNSNSIQSSPVSVHRSLPNWMTNKRPAESSKSDESSRADQDKLKKKPKLNL